MHTIGTTTASLLLLAVFSAAPLHAQDESPGYSVMAADGEFADVVFELQSAIENRGLVIDFQGHVGDMLSRTAEVVEMSSPYVEAEYLQFCSATLTHAAVAASPDNLAVCPYVVFAYTLASAPEEVQVGYRRPVGATDAASMDALGAIEELLQDVVSEVSGTP